MGGGAWALHSRSLQLFSFSFSFLFFRNYDWIGWIFIPNRPERKNDNNKNEIGGRAAFSDMENKRCMFLFLTLFMLTSSSSSSTLGICMLCSLFLTSHVRYWLVSSSSNSNTSNIRYLSVNFIRSTIVVVVLDLCMLNIYKFPPHILPRFVLLLLLHKLCKQLISSPFILVGSSSSSSSSSRFGQLYAMQFMFHIFNKHGIPHQVLLYQSPPFEELLPERL